MTAWTADRPAPGLVVHQPARGFRYGAEAFWLVGYALERGAPATALDLGTGSGILAWLLARHGIDVIGVELRPEWGEAWDRTRAASTVYGSVALVQGDVGTASLPRVDLVVSNPPFFPAGSGPEPADPWRRAARFEGPSPLATFVTVACDRLTPGGRACLVVPVEREAHLLAAVPAGHHAARVVRVGHRRVLVALEAGEGTPTVEEVRDRGPDTDRWYRRAVGLPEVAEVRTLAGP